MHLLSCPQCDASIPVSTSKAGQQIACPQCDCLVDVPKLGELRKAPLADEAAQSKDAGQVSDTGVSGGKSVLFVGSSLIATACLLVAIYCGIRWVLIDVPMTTNQHIAVLKDELPKRTAAELIREYEDMEKFGPKITRPMNYKLIANDKSEWGFNTLVASSVGAICVLVAAVSAKAK